MAEASSEQTMQTELTDTQLTQSETTNSMEGSSSSNIRCEVNTVVFYYIPLY